MSPKGGVTRLSVKRVLFLLCFLCTVVCGWAAETTFSTSDINNNSDKSFTKDGITVTTSINNDKSKGFKLDKNSSTLVITSSSSSITSIEFTFETFGKGVATTTGTVASASASPQTWSGSATSITFTGAQSTACVISSIKVTTDGTTPSEKTKYLVKTVANTNGTIAVKVGETATTIAEAGTEIEEGTALTFTATPNSGYTFANWTVLSGTTTTTESSNPYSISSLAAATTVTANWTKQEEATGTVYSFADKTGTTSIGSGLTQDKSSSLKFGSNFKKNAASCVTITPKSGTFKAGDKVSVTLYSTKTGNIDFFDELSGTTLYTAAATSTSTTLTFTLDEDADQLYLARTSGSTIYVTALTVERSGSDTQALTASLSERTKTVIVGAAEQTFSLPTLTVKAGDEVTTDYTVSYASDNESVAKVSNSKLVVGTTTGLAHITFTISPKTTNDLSTTYTATTVTYTVTVKEKSPLSLSVSDISINSIDATATQPTIRVYDDNNNRLTLGTDYTLSCKIKGSQNVTFNSETNTFTVAKNSTDNTKFAVGSDTITVTATPTGDYANYYTAVTDSFAYNVVEGKLATNFHSAFSQLSIKVKAGSSATTTVPVVYNGTDISDYFTYTYSIVTSGAKSTISTKGKYITFTGNASDSQVQVKVSAKPTTAYEDLYTAPADLTFTVNVSSSYTVATVSTDPSSVSMYAGESTALPDVTVKDSDKKTLTEGENYTLTWVSFSPNVASVSNGQIHGLSEGTAVLHVVVSGDNLQSVTDTVVVDVDDPAIFRISATNASNVTENNSLWNSAHTMRVTLGGWLFPNNVNITSGAVSGTEALGDGKWSNAAKVTKSGEVVSGFDYYAGGTNNKNARQENGSNAQPNSTNAWNGTKEQLKNVVIRDPMFNIPCAGSYVVVQTKSIGTANVIIYQNGAFDMSNSKKQYRPQRRVFVLDEAGNAISATARLANTTGKPTGGYTLSDYTWDWGGTDAATPTVEAVKQHFGLSSFEMSSTGFQNGVYESCLTYDQCANELVKDKTTEEMKAMAPGLRGWSVLADAPVIYTFDTKPGKTYYIYNYGSKIGLYGFSFEEKAATVDAISYNQDVQSQTITKTEEGHVATVSLDRVFKGGVWNAAVLPFSLHKQQIDAIFGTTYSKGNTDGTDILYFDRVEGTTAYFVRHAYNNIVAGKPFLIKPKNTGDITINTAELENFPYVTIEADSEPEKWCTSGGYSWVSSYANQTIKNGDYYLSGKTGKFTGRTAGDLVAKGFRGFLQAESSSSAKELSLAKTASFIEDENEPTTAIVALEMQADGTYVERPTTGKIYSVGGQLVSNDAADFSSLPSGIYIINGKKYVK